MIDIKMLEVGTVPWQEAMTANIYEKFLNDKRPTPGDVAFMEVQTEHINKTLKSQGLIS